uniref:Endoribonuclease n=1 Tax=Panagrellus redivivus TaxID=6233 RepID=A0A7E4VCG4_PANRE
MSPPPRPPHSSSSAINGVLVGRQRVDLTSTSRMRYLALLLIPALFAAVLARRASDGPANQQSLPPFDITDEEIQMAVQRFRAEDINKAKPSQLKVNFQGHTTARDTSDAAKLPLFTSVDSSIFRKPTYEAFQDLLDNYNFEVGQIENSNNKERAEVVKFIDLLFETRPWKILQDILTKKKHPIAKDTRTFKLWTRQLWFEDYSRARGVADSSGFEHVFVGESKNGEIAGLHNWVQFYLLERNASSHLDYKGFIIKRFDLMGVIRYTWNGVTKRTGGFLIGTSPEFDMSLFTLCFLSRRGAQTCDFDIDGCPFSVTSYDIKMYNKVFVGTIYPSAGPLNEQCRLSHRRIG